jgi:hypothetical protein
LARPTVDRYKEHRAFKFVFFPEGITGKDTQKILHIDPPFIHGGGFQACTQFFTKRGSRMRDAYLKHAIQECSSIWLLELSKLMASTPPNIRGRPTSEQM